ncbi:invasion associated locus B family protein [Hansschlegelia plantiphila]|uniref:Invasion protein n=1 Tax=Hansschlegelia plantiphila TaxID=374655 RepID=A0A9W6MXB9_9HYPH|nr:invasion associated locus B family protein [Hansschlegelia plantiphila]GLK69732.1 invasion protein [Hansschlegelia plantiphila]
MRSLSRFFRMLVVTSALFVAWQDAVAQLAPPADWNAPDATVASTDPAGDGGAVSETHGDWTVSCMTTEAGKACRVSQQQSDRAGGRRPVAIELTPSGDKAVGLVFLPSNVEFGEGVTFGVDDTVLGGSVARRACLPSGCPALLIFDRAALAKIKIGAGLTVLVKTADSGQVIKFTLGLKGFSSALARAAELAGR